MSEWGKKYKLAHFPGGVVPRSPHVTEVLLHNEQ